MPRRRQRRRRPQQRPFTQLQAQRRAARARRRRAARAVRGPRRMQPARSALSLSLLHPGHSPYLGHPALRMTPRLVVSERSFSPFAVPTGTGNWSVALITPMLSSAGNLSCAEIGKVGSGTGVPGTTESSIPTSIMSGVSTGNEYRLNRLAVTITVAPGAVSSLYPTTTVLFGTLRGRMNRTGFATYNAIGNWLASLPEITCRAAPALAQHAVHLVSYPLDVPEFHQFSKQSASVATSNEESDRMCTIAIAIQQNVIGSLDTVALSVSSEWDVMATNNTDPFLHAAHKLQQTAPLPVWEKLTAAAFAAGGVVEAVGAVGAALGRGAIADAMPVARVALPAIMDMAPIGL